MRNTDGTVEYGRLQCWRAEFNKEPNGYPYILTLAYRAFGVGESHAFIVNNLVALDNQTGVTAKHRITIRQLGAAQGGVVNSGSGRALAALLGFIVFILWCLGILFLTRLRDTLRTPRPEDVRDETPPVLGFLDHGARPDQLHPRCQENFLHWAIKRASDSRRSVSEPR